MPCDETGVPSMRAAQAALRVHATGVSALAAAHDPSLGLDRSVCVRDIVGWLRAQPNGKGTYADAQVEMAEAIEVEFGGKQ